MCQGKLALQNIIDNRAKIFRGWYRIPKLSAGVQILDIKAFEDVAPDALVKIDEIADHACVSVHLTADGDFKRVIMPVTVRVVAFAVGCPIFFGRHLLAMQAMRSRKSITTGQ